MVLVRSLLVAFHVVPVYERLNPLLQIARLWEKKVIHMLMNFVVGQRLNEQT